MIANFLSLQSSSARPNILSTGVPRNIAVSNTPKSPAILTPRTNLQQQQQQPSVKVVKVFSSLASSSQTQSLVTKPLVQIVPNPQGSIQQQQSGITTDMTTPKVVSVQSLQSPANRRVVPLSQQNKVTVQKLVLSSGHKIHLQTPISQNVTPVSNNSPQFQVKTVPVQLSQPQPQIRTVTNPVLPATPVSRNQLPQQMSTPLGSPAVSASYKPLESLKEVNRQATQASVVSPVSAVIPEAAASIKKSPTEIRNQVTVSDRYRYIVPQQQTSVSGVPVSSVTAAAQQLVQTSPTSAIPVAAAAQPVQTVRTAIPIAVQPVTQAPQAPQQVLQVL